MTSARGTSATGRSPRRRSRSRRTDVAAPLVCPGCGTGGASSERFCPRCGSPFVLAPGRRRPRVAARRRGGVRARKIHPPYAEGEPVRVATAQNQPEAELLQGLLLEAGIPSLVRRSGGFDVPDFLAAGPRDVLVPRGGEAAARELLGTRRRRSCAASAPVVGARAGAGAGGDRRRAGGGGGGGRDRGLRRARRNCGIEGGAGPPSTPERTESATTGVDGDHSPSARQLRVPREAPPPVRTPPHCRS